MSFQSIPEVFKCAKTKQNYPITKWYSFDVIAKIIHTLQKYNDEKPTETKTSKDTIQHLVCMTNWYQILNMLF